jgi:non-heme chloroperoxidase
MRLAKPLVPVLVMLLLLVGCATTPAATHAPIQGFAQGKDGVRLHFLDFRGRGEPVVLLPGAGNTAWVYAQFGPLLARNHRVYALTRRGHGGSDMPERGYDLATLTEDLRLFLDQRGIRRVHLVGYATAGAELTMFAGRYPERVATLVYLDAAYDRSAQGPVEAGSPERPSPPTAEDR